MRSEVSSRSRRSGGVVVEEGGEGEEGGKGMGIGFAAAVNGGVLDMPDSRRTESSWSGSGRR